jgi:chromosome segregation ATPase
LRTSETRLADRDVTVEKLRADLQAKDAIVTEMRNTIRDSIIDTGELKRNLATAVAEKQTGITPKEHNGVKRQLVLSDERVRALDGEIARLKSDQVKDAVTTEEHSEVKRRLADRVQQQDGEIARLRIEMQALSVAGHATNVRIQQLYAWAQKEAHQVQDKQQQVTQLKLQVDVLQREKQDLQREKQDLATKVQTFRDNLESSSTELAKQKESGSAVAAGLRATALHLQRQLNLQQKEHRTPLLPPPPPQPPAFLQPSVPFPPLLPVISMWATGGATALPPQQLGSGGNLHTQCVAEELQGKLSWAMHAFQQKQAELAQVRIQLTWAQEAFTKLYNNAAHETCEIHRQQATDIVRRRNIINVTRLAQLEARVAVVDVALVATAGDTAQKSWRESAERRLSEYRFARETEWSAQLADLQAQLWEAQTTSLVVVRQLQTEKELSARTAQCAAEQTQQLRRLQLAANQVLGRMQESHPAECEQLLQEMRRLQPHATSTELDIYAVLSLLGRLESRDVERHTRIAAGAVVLGAASPAQTTPRHQAPPAVLDLTADSDSDC